MIFNMFKAAKDVFFNNKDTGLESKNVQGAIEEHVGDKDNPHGVTAEQIGLGNVLDSIKTLNTNLQSTLFSNGGALEEKIKYLIENKKLPSDRPFMIREAYTAISVCIGHIYNSWNYGGFLVISFNEIYYATVSNGTLGSLKKIPLTTSDLNSILSETGSLLISKDANTEISVKVENSKHIGMMCAAYGGDFGIYDNTFNKWLIKSDNAGNVTLNGTANKATNDSEGRNIAEALNRFANIYGACALYTGDLNNINVTSFYNTNVGTDQNSPTGRWGFVLTFMHSFAQTDGLQVFITMQGDADIYIRQKGGGNWYDWEKNSNDRGIEFKIVDGELQYRYDTEVWG